ncbi:MAG: spore coat protein U domain-containing protein [Bacteriovorax sp.]
MKLNFAIFFLFLSSKAFADCGYSLSAPALNYTVSDVTPATAYNVTLSRTKAGGPRCDDFIMGFSKGGASSYNRVATNSLTGATLAYNLYKTSNTTSSLKEIQDATSNAELLSGSISKNSSLDLNYYFTLGALSSSSLTRGGIYRDTVTIAVDSGTPNDHGLETSQALSVNITVPKVASLSLVNAGEAYDSFTTTKTLDFGELTANEEMSFDVIVISNAGYTLGVSSSNNEVLQLLGGAASTANQVAYDFYANGIQKNLTSSSTTPVTLSSGAGVTPMQGARIPIKVVIQSVTDKAAGTYQDYVTFTIATTE